MKIVSNWLRDFVEIPADFHQLARDLTAVGMAVDAVEDGVLEIDITTNRVDAMNHYGMARECAVIYDRDLQPCNPVVKESARPATEAAAVEIADADLCARYCGRVILGVKVGPSPRWMVERLEAAGQRSINNVADATNYLMLELGQPLHAFDLDKLGGRRIIVRRAAAGERMATLDGVERVFTTEDLLIADAAKPVAVAGVMGGLESEISDRTANVLLESAWFEPRSIRKTAKRLGLRTEASHRFERGADVGLCAKAADRAAALIQELAGGEILKGVLDAYPGQRQRAAIELRRSELDRFLGISVPATDVLRILRRLGFMAEELGRGSWKMIPPTWRLDIEREIDLVEEVARHYGYDRIPNTLPAWSGQAHRYPAWPMERALRTTARALGYDETVSITLTAAVETERFSSTPPVTLHNPLSAESAVLRTSILPGLLESVARNLNRGVVKVRLFEAGNIYRHEGSGYDEPPVFGLAATGDTDFYQIKGDVEALLDLFACPQPVFEAGGIPYFHPGRSARVLLDGEEAARFGQIHPDIAGHYGFRPAVLAAEFFLAGLYRRGLRAPSYQAVSRFPAVDRDFSLLLPESVAFARIEAAVRALSLPDLQEVVPAEIYRGEGIPAGQYSLLLRVRFQSSERTLSDAEVNDHSTAIIAALQKQLGAVLRA